MKKTTITTIGILFIILVTTIIMSADLEPEVLEPISISDKKIDFNTEWNTARVELKQDKTLFADTFDLSFEAKGDSYKVIPTNYDEKAGIQDLIYTLESDIPIYLWEEINPEFNSVTAYTRQENPKDEWNEHRQVWDFEKECKYNCTYELSKDEKTFTLHFKQDLKDMNLVYYNLSACGTLSTIGGVYTLNKSVSSTVTCISITANNIDFDCAGYDVVYGTTLSTNKYGIYIGSGVTGVKVRNCNVKAGNIGDGNYPIYNLGHYNLITNNNVTTATAGASQNGIYMVGSDYSNLTYNNITTSTSGSDAIECYSSCTGNIYANNIITGISTGISFHTNNNGIIVENNTIISARDLSFYGGGSSNIIRNNNLFSTTSQTMYAGTGTYNNNLVYNNKINASASAIQFGAITGTGNNVTNNNITLNGLADYGIAFQGDGATNSNKETYVSYNDIYIKDTSTGSIGIAIIARSEDSIVEHNNIYVDSENSYGIKILWRFYSEPDHIIRNNRVYLTANNTFCYSHMPNFEYANVSFTDNYCEVSAQKGIVYFEVACYNNEISFDIANLLINNTYKGVDFYAIKEKTRIKMHDIICNGAWAYRYIKED